jgi:acyl-CoA thioesterase
MDDAIERMKQDAFARLLGIELVDAGPGRARVQMTVKDEHRNSVGMVHGGVIFTLADYTFAVACNSHGVPAVAVQCSISYFRPPQGAVLTAEASEVSLTRRLGTYTVHVRDTDGEVVALFQGMAYRKDGEHARAR